MAEGRRADRAPRRAWELVSGRPLERDGMKGAWLTGDSKDRVSMAALG